MIATPDDEIDKPGWFVPPFTDGWWYQGATYAGHSDAAVDFNRRTKSGGWLEDAGDPVLAAADGTVAEVDKANGLVMLNHWQGLWRTEYRHMTDITVKVGDRVRRGDRIGSIGNVAGDGRSVGAHLHHVHWKRASTLLPWKRVQMRFYDRPIAVSVVDSDSRPASWDPPAPVMVQGPPPPPTWESACKEAIKALAKSEAAFAAQKAQTALVTDERDQARRDLAIATAKIVELDKRIAELEATNPDCTAAVTAERRRVVDAMVAGMDLLASSLR